MATEPQPASQNVAPVERSDSVDRRVRAMAGPPVRGGKLAGWFGLLLCLLAALPPLLIELGRPDVLDPHEGRALAISRHTAAAVEHGQALSLGERLVPMLNGRPRADEPPGLHWLLRLACSGLDPQTAAAESFIWRARLVSAAFALVIIAAVYWAALSIGGSYSAVFAALVCLASPLLLYEGRTADGSVVTTSFSMLSIAAALWAIRPLRPAPSVERQFIGWVVCGLAMAAAVLTAGLGAGIATAAPILLMLVLCPERQSHLMGLVAAMLIAALAVLPWAMLSQELDAAAWRQWLSGGDLAPSAILAGWEAAVRWRVVWLVLATLPWTLWLVAAIVQPFSTSSSGARTRLFLSWAWLAVAVAVYLSAPDAPRRSLLPAVAAAAVLVGQLFARYGELAAVGRYPRFWRLMRWPHVLLLAGVSVVPPLLLGLQPAWVAQGRMSDVLIAVTPTNQLTLVGLSIALLLALVLSGRWLRRHQPGHALAAWSAWVVIYAAVAAVLVVRSRLLSNPLNDHWQLMDGVAGQRTIYWLSDRAGEPTIDASLLFYANRPLPALRTGEIGALLAEQKSQGSTAALAASPYVNGQSKPAVSEHQGPAVLEGPAVLVLADSIPNLPNLTQAEAGQGGPGGATAGATAANMTATRLTDFTVAGRALWRLNLTQPAHTETPESADATADPPDVEAVSDALQADTPAARASATQPTEPSNLPHSPFSPPATQPSDH